VVILLSPSGTIDGKENKEDARRCCPHRGISMRRDGWMERRNNRIVKRKTVYLDSCIHSQVTAISILPDIRSKPSKRNIISIENLNDSNTNQNRTKNRPFSFSFPSTLPNGTFAHPNNRVLNVNLLDDGFSAVVCPRAL
jgi:hypothetical protein